MKRPVNTKTDSHANAYDKNSQIFVKILNCFLLNLCRISQLIQRGLVDRGVQWRSIEVQQTSKRISHITRSIRCIPGGITIRARTYQINSEK